MGAQCTGECCEVFVLTMERTLEKIETRLRYTCEDGNFIADMLIPLYPLIAGAKLPDGEVITEERAKDGALGWAFTCKHFDREKRLCGVYNERPLMCRDFPYGKPCEHGAKCGWDKGRAGQHPPRIVKYEDTQLESGRTARRVHLAIVDEMKFAVVAR
jgi:Fe-S-cluster containining protein